MSIINGWGRGTGGEGAWNEGLTAAEPAGQAITSGIGSLSVVALANQTLTGRAITSGLGSVSVAALANQTLTGQGINSGLGSVSVVAPANVSVTGQRIT